MNVQVIEFILQKTAALVSLQSTSFTLQKDISCMQPLRPDLVFPFMSPLVEGEDNPKWCLEQIIGGQPIQMRQSNQN